MLIVEVQEAAQAFTTGHRRVVVGRRCGCRRCRDQLAPKALVSIAALIAAPAQR